MTDLLTIEIGHTYAPERLVDLCVGGSNGDFYSTRLDRYFNDTPEAQRLRRIADYFGPAATRVALLDDVSARQSQEGGGDSWRWQHFINFSAESLILGTGIESENLFYESDFEQAGRTLAASMTSSQLPDGYRLSKDGRKIITGSGRNRLAIPLYGFNGHSDPSYPSCQVLDLAWLQKRLTLAPLAITVLPVGYRKQQRGVRALANLTEINPISHKTIFLK